MTTGSLCWVAHFPPQNFLMFLGRARFECCILQPRPLICFVPTVAPYGL